MTRAVLGLDSAFPLDPHQRLDELGMDSLLGIDIVQGVSEALAITLSPTLALDYPTAAAMAGAISRRQLSRSP